MTVSPPFTSEWIAQFLAKESLAAQMTSLQAAHLLDEEGLHTLCDYAEDQLRADPSLARSLLVSCEAIGGQMNLVAFLPRTAYLRAQAHAIFGEYVEAATWIAQARAGYEATGQPAEAIRTYAGLMQVLAESGRYQEALEAGQTILRTVENTSPSIPPDMAGFLAAKAHQNRGRIFELMGRPAEALNAYEQAEHHFSALNMPTQVGHIRVNRGLSLLDQGRVREALVSFENALVLFDQAKEAYLQAQTLTNLADAHLHLGNYYESLRAYAQARLLFQTLDIEAEQKLLLLDTAHAYLALNLYSEALATFTEAEAFLKARGMVAQQARALWGIGTVLSALKMLEAEAPLAAAAELFRQADNHPLQATILLEQSALLLARGEKGLALQKANEAHRLVNPQTSPVEYVYSLFKLADLLLPDVSAAETQLQIAQPVIARLGLPHLRFRLNQRLGHLYFLQGREIEALPALTTAIEDIENLRGTLPHENMRAAFLRDKITAFEDLVQLYLNRGDHASLQQAFGIAERAKSRALVDLLTGLIDLRAPSDRQHAEHLRALQADLNAIYTEMLNPTSSGERYVAFEILSEQALALENEIQLLQLQTLGKPLPITSLDPSSLPDISGFRDEMMLVYHLVGDEIIAFFFYKGQLTVQRNLSTPAKIAPLIQKLAMQWQRFRLGASFIERHTRQLEQSAKYYLGLLYDALLRPLRPLLESSSALNLVIVPHGLLHQIPFHALFDGQHYLLETHHVSYAPSATIYELCQQRVSRHTGQALIMGVPDLSIPFVADEVRRVSSFFANPRTYLEDFATTTAFHDHAPQSDVVHLACHGLFRSGNPMFSALKLDDAWLTATEVLTQDLQGALVTLSACESGRNQVLVGDEIIGLTRAFLGAGAVTLVVSQWLVEDKSTAQLMTTFYEQLTQGQTRAEALRTAQLTLKEQYPHPYYWAPFILIGQR